MNSACESRDRPGDSRRGAEEDNRVAARRGGEQSESEGWSRTEVNSIRQTQRASLLAKGEACRFGGEPATARGLSKPWVGRGVGGWSGNGPKGTWDKWRDRRGELTRAGVRGSIVAMKPGNAGGAKGSRKVKAR